MGGNTIILMSCDIVDCIGNNMEFDKEDKTNMFTNSF